MATVHIPAAMRSLTGGASRIHAPGETLLEVIEALDAAHPGLKARMVEGTKLRAGLAAFVDGEIAAGGLRAKVGPEAEVHFAPAIAGG